jgi:hypothetical protein
MVNANENECQLRAGRPGLPDKGALGGLGGDSGFEFGGPVLKKSGSLLDLQTRIIIICVRFLSGVLLPLLIKRLPVNCAPTNTRASRT